MLLLVIGLTWCVSSAKGHIPPWTPSCPQQSYIPNACIFGNLTVNLFHKTMQPKDCNSQVNINEFQYTPVIHINSTNTTDRFTVVLVNLGANGQGPSYLNWMVTNVSIISLPSYSTIPTKNVINSYNSTFLRKGVNHRTLIQILVFRHNNVLKVPFTEIWVKRTEKFSLSTLFSNTSPNLRLCGPVAGTQYWLVDYTPSAPFQQGVQPLQPVYIPVVPVVPVGQTPVPGMVPGGYAPHPSMPDHHQHVHKTFPKKSSGSKLQPVQTLFIPLVILTVMCL